jgi:hypothetical protein
LYGYAPNKFKNKILELESVLKEHRKFYEENMKNMPIESQPYLTLQKKDFEVQKNLEDINKGSCPANYKLFNY